jgi:DNA-binding MarR family transcriptional regulator/catechol 2,3-dioxygenase-like lactoylglutathione lyase family enzyme
LTIKELVYSVEGMNDPDRLNYATPTLMRAARGAYAQSIRAQLNAIGVDDLPRNGVFILAGIDPAGGPRQDLPTGLGVSKQAVSQVVDVLVNRGYLTRSPDPSDRRRNSLELTGRGQEVVEAVRHGVEDVDQRLLARVPADQVEAMRVVLATLAEIKVTGLETGTGLGRPARQFRQFSPIFPVRDLAAALAHYTALGFTTLAYAGGADYGFANRDGTGLHFAADPGHEAGHQHRVAAYLYVRDADALYEEWSRPGIGGQTRPVGLMEYGLREGSHLDPDGNEIRFGSPVADG